MKERITTYVTFLSETEAPHLVRPHGIAMIDGIADGVWKTVLSNPKTNRTRSRKMLGKNVKKQWKEKDQFLE